MLAGAEAIAWRGKPYSLDFMKRVVAAVVTGGRSCNETGKQFGVAVSTAVGWLQPQRETGSIAPGKMDGHRPKAISGKHRVWVLERKGGRFHLAGAGCRARTKAAPDLPLFRRGILGPLGNAVSH
jgi:transposase